VRKCSYAWIINRSTGFGDSETLKKEMKKILLHTDGWAVEGYQFRYPRTGWYTHTPNATFSIIIRDLPVDTKVLTILSMKSYSGKWRNSKLAVSTTIVPPKNELPCSQQKVTNLIGKLLNPLTYIILMVTTTQKQVSISNTRYRFQEVLQKLEILSS